MLVRLREWYIHLFKKKILMIEKNKKFISNKFIIYLLNLFYFFVKNLLKINKINIIYELDGLIFYDDNSIREIKINQIMLEFNIINPEIENYKKDFTNEINKYSRSIPFYIIVSIDKININFNVQIKLMSMGKITIREFKIANILNKKLYELMM